MIKNALTSSLCSWKSLIIAFLCIMLLAYVQFKSILDYSNPKVYNETFYMNPQNRMQLFLMTRNEMPLLKDWVLYHGDMFGYSNLHVIDGSDQPETISFLQDVERDLGVIVHRSDANLNQLETLINEIINEHKYKSDFVIKLDTDELLSYLDENGALQIDKEGMLRYLDSLYKTVDGFKYKVGYKMDNLRTSGDCDPLKSPIQQFTKFDIPEETTFKTFFASETFGSIDLGSHRGKVVGRKGFFGKLYQWYKDIDKFHTSKINVLHYHNQCLENVIDNNRKAVISHGYISESDSESVVIEKLTVLVGDPTSVNGYAVNCVPSCHKVKELLIYLVDKESYRRNFYASATDNSDSIETTEVSSKVSRLVSEYDGRVLNNRRNS